LNQDGRPDLCLLHRQGTFTYHFNRGFCCFGEEGDLRLPDAAGQVACAVADFNGDGSLDLAVAFADGAVRCYFNDSFNKPLLRIGLAPGVPGPLTASVWQTIGPAEQCMGTLSIQPGIKSCFAPRGGSSCTVKWFMPGQGMRTRQITLPAELPAGGIEVLIGT
jgi:hypothetical protein